MNFSDALAFLANYTNYERELRYPYDGWAMNLERMQTILDALDRPDRGLAVIHIAGTKGKGSAAVMIEAMLRAAGHATGLFTSPHLLDFRERIRIRGEMIAEAAVARGVERLVPAVAAVARRPELGPVTYFELLTALAVLAFAEAGVRAVALEAGLGGRYDATTACAPVVSVLTPVSYDHMDILGETLTAIAGEKAMIVKAGVPAVIAPQPAEAGRVFSARCREVGAAEVRVEERYTWRRLSEDPSGQRFELRGDRDLADLFLPLVGDHQLVNAATAVAAVDRAAAAGLRVDDAAVRSGLASVSWPARFQRVRQAPDLILDGAHNAASAAYLRETLGRLYPGRRALAALGLGADKDVEGFGRELGPALAAVYLTRSRTMKAAPAERLRRALSGFALSIVETDTVAEALASALSEARSEDVVVVTGSFYVIAEAMTVLAGR